MKHDIEKSLNNSRPVLAQDKREALWSRVEEHLAAQKVRSPYMGWVRTHATTATALLLVMILIGSGSTTALAQKARPGDVLFPVERAIERLEIKFARSEEKRTALSVEHAEERISELKDLIGTSRSRFEVSATSTSDAHVSASVEALVHVVTESKMSTSERERVFENLFQEIDPLSINVRVNASSNSVSGRDRVEIDRDDRRETRIEIRDADKRTRIERKDGKVRIEYDESNDDDRRKKQNDD